MARCMRDGIRYKRHRFRTHRGSPDASRKACTACGAAQLVIDQATAPERRIERRRKARFRRRWLMLAKDYMPLDRAPHYVRELRKSGELGRCIGIVVDEAK